MLQTAVTSRDCSFLVPSTVVTESCDKKSLGKSGEPLPVDNKENFPNNIAYYPQAPDVIRAMKQGLKLLEEGQKPDPAEEVPLPDGLEPEGPPKSERGKAKKESGKKQEAQTETGKTDKMADKKTVENGKAKDEKPKGKGGKEQTAKKEMKEPQKVSQKLLIIIFLISPKLGLEECRGEGG